LQLTTEQQTLLRNYVLADPVFSVLPANNSSALQIAEALNLPTNPAFIVWKTNVTKAEITKDPGFTWTLVDNLTVGKARIWDWLFDNASSSIDPSSSHIRAGIDECWKGTAQMVAVRDAILALCKRTANGIEKILSTGTGSTVDPAVLSAQGTLVYLDVVKAMGWAY
jgi:hypothetical protein